MEIKDKKILSSYDELVKIFALFKKVSKHIFSNYIPNPALHNKWIKDRAVYIYIFDSAVFIIHDKEFMADALFIARDKMCVALCMSIIHKDIQKPIVLERVIRENKDESLGFLPNYVLRRMSRIGIFEAPREKSQRVEKATIEDVAAISGIFKSFFNPLTERIPDKSELDKLIRESGISVIRHKDGIAGMVIYEMDTTNIHLRYWWVNPDSRNMGFGAELLRDFFAAGQNCKRQFLWVFSDNSDAIAKYEHYGFKFDGIADEIYINN